MKKEPEFMRLQVQNNAFEKFIANPAFVDLMSVVIEHVNASIEKKENGTASEDDDQCIAFGVQLMEAIETLENDTSRLYAENAAMARVIERLSDKPCQIVFKHED